jgi:hypothetical protein
MKIRGKNITWEGLCDFVDNLAPSAEVEREQIILSSMVECFMKREGQINGG